MSSNTLSNSLKYNDKEILNSTFTNRKYKKTYPEQPKPICTSPISKLSDRVGKFFDGKVDQEDFYRTLLKNNIDPESKQVKKILKDLELEDNKTHTKVVSTFLKAKDLTDDTIGKLEDKITAKPMRQSVTSFDKENQRRTSIDSNLNKKKRFGVNQFDNSDIFSNKGNKLSRDNSVMSTNSARSKKVEFMSNSNVFATPACPTQKDIKVLASKYSGTIMANFSTKSSLGHGKHDNVRVDSKSKAGMKYKNVLSESNIAQNSFKKDPNSVNIRIVGLNGKSNLNSIKEVDQKKQTYNLIEWNISKRTKSKSGLSLSKVKSEESIGSASTSNSTANQSNKIKNIQVVKTTPLTKSDNSRQSFTPKTNVNKTFLSMLKK